MSKKVGEANKASPYHQTLSEITEMQANHIVTSSVHGDHSAFADFTAACRQAALLNTRLFDSVVYSPLIEMDYEITREDESALNRRFHAEAYTVQSV